MIRRLKMSKIWAIVIIMALVSISACVEKSVQPSQTPGTTTTTGITEKTIEIKGYAFNPPTITISKNTKVTWIQSDSDTHTVTSIAGDVLNSPVLSKGQTYSYTFNEDGTFEYRCKIHTSMKGTIIVK